MKKLRVFALLAVAPFMFATAAHAAPVTRTAPPFVDGFYSIKGNDTKNPDVELFVGRNGKEIIGGVHGSGVSCAPSAAAEAAGANLNLDLYFPRSIPISASGSFSYTGEVVANAAQNELSTDFDGTATFSGHFIKGRIVAYKTNALVGSFSSPSMCDASTPTHVVDQWDINDK
jgi:hypothetical protein